MSDFKREDRYIVIKRSDLKKVPVAYCSALVDPMFSLLSHLPRRECVVVESDWPEYQLVWAMIEHRMAGKPVPDFNLWRRADALQALLTAAEDELDRCKSMALMIEEKEWAEHVGKGPISYRVESAFTQLHNELSDSRQSLTAADEQIDLLSPRHTEQPEGKRERFEKWVMATKHPVYGFLDGRSLARGDDRTGYADEYMQGLWVSYLAFGAEQLAPVPVVPERLVMTDGLHTYEYVTGHNAAIDKMLGVKS
ncbi:hypothetical protein [Pseudomonas lactis]|uniref:hypothetical protein n=1 Tax=Pseudomonas lactis TaxID=1615674 RepID=UPI000648C084|nr:hypothetical protein [Pseudomonas lactis]